MHLKHYLALQENTIHLKHVIRLDKSLFLLLLGDGWLDGGLKVSSISPIATKILTTCCTGSDSFATVETNRIHVVCVTWNFVIHLGHIEDTHLPIFF
jgi:hypothetical protein